MAIFEYFPGANTPKGFYSYYDYILKSEEAKRIIILKGGPGTGKSTFMKKVGKHIASLGYDIELLHCSSDPNSLDGVCARDIGFLILDGTSPHIVDPKCPGAVDEIINLGECWDDKGISKNKEDIIKTGQMISACYNKAYKYLKSAKSLQIDDEQDDSEIKKIKKDLMLNDTIVKKGNIRKAFLSAVTPLGNISYIDTFKNNSKNIYKIESRNSKRIMNELSKMLVNGGYNVREFYCPMSPDERIEHIYADGIFFTVDNEFSSNVLDFDLYKNLLSHCEEEIKMAKKLHDKLEQYYIPYMNFDKVEKTCNDVLNSIQ